MIPAVEAVDVLDHLAPAVDAEVHVDIGHADALGVQEALEEEGILDRVHVRDVQAVGHHAARRAAAAGAHGDAVSLGVADEVRDDEEVVHKAHLPDHVELILQLLVHLGASGKTLGKAPFAELFQIGIAVRLPFGKLEAGQVIVAELEVEMAALGDLHRVVGGLGILREKGAHLLFVLEIELLGLEAHAVRLVHGLARLDAHEHVLVIGVLLLSVVGVVGDGQGDAQLFREADQPLGGLPFLPDAVVLDLQVEVLRAEKGLQVQGAGLRSLIVVVDQGLWDLPGETAGETDEPLAVPMQQLPVDAGADIEALGEARGHEVAQVVIARLVFAQEDQMGVVVVDAVVLLKAAARGHVNLAADDGLDAGALAGLVKGHRAVHDPVVGEGEGALPQGLCPLRHLVDAAGPVQQGELTVHM